MKLKFQPFRDFWLDCHSTILFTLILSDEKMDSLVACRNHYRYFITDETCNDGMKYKSINPIYRSFILQDKILFNEREIFFNDSESFLKEITTYLDQNKVLLLNVDMYEWVTDTLHWHKNHIKHFALITGYDDEQRIIYTYESGGSEDYHEYKMSYEHMILATEKEECALRVYDLVLDPSIIMFNGQNIREDAMTTLDTINHVLENFESIWDIHGYSDENINHFCDIVASHLYALENRYIANGMLFRKYYGEKNELFHYNLLEEFETLRYESEKLKLLIRRYHAKRKVNEKLIELKDKLKSIFEKEKSIWEYVIGEELIMVLDNN